MTVLCHSVRWFLSGVVVHTCNTITWTLKQDENFMNILIYMGNGEQEILLPKKKN